MDVFLTKEELVREENLLRPHQESYTALKARMKRIEEIKPVAEMDSDRPKPPPSC